MTESAEENQGTKSVENNHDDDDLNTEDQHVDQNGSEFITRPTESDNKGMSRCEGSISDKVTLKVVFTPTVHNGNSSKNAFSRNETSSNDTGCTAEKIESANAYSQDTLKMCEMTTAVLTSSDSLPGLKPAMQAEPAMQNVPDSTVSNIDHIMSQTTLNGDDTRSKANYSTVSGVTVATIQVEETDGKETNTVENKKTIMSSELQDDHNVISSNDNNETTCTSDKQLASSIHCSEGGAKTDVTMPIRTTKGHVVEGDEDLNVEILGPDEMPTCSDKAPETVESSNQRRRSATSSAGNSSQERRDESPRPRKRASTISFKVESTTLLREASLEIEPLDVVVSSCSTSPISELLEDSEDVVNVNPEAEQVSYSNTLTRKRAKSGLDSVIKKSANSALKRSVKVNASVEETDFDDAIGDESLSPVPRVNTLNRFRNTFSWKRGRSVTRQSFAGKSKDNFLSFHNIRYTVQQKRLFRTLGTKVILKNVRYVIKSLLI